jgi:hypothetical protein
MVRTTLWHWQLRWDVDIKASNLLNEPTPVAIEASQKGKQSDHLLRLKLHGFTPVN